VPQKRNKPNQDHVDIAIELLCHGTTRRGIIKYFSSIKDAAPLPIEDIDAAISEARRQIAEQGQANREEEIGKARLRYEHLYSRSLAIQDFKTCKSIQDNICNLLGLSNVAPDNKFDRANDALNAFLNSVIQEPNAETE